MKQLKKLLVIADKISAESHIMVLKLSAEQTNKLISEAEQQKSRIAALEFANIALLLENVFYHQKLTQTSIIMPTIQQKPSNGTQPNYLPPALAN